MAKKQRYGIHGQGDFERDVAQDAVDRLIDKVAAGEWLAEQAAAFYETTVADLPESRHAGQLRERFKLRLGNWTDKAAKRRRRELNRLTRTGTSGDAGRAEAFDPINTAAQQREADPADAAISAVQADLAHRLVDQARDRLRPRDAAFVWLKLAQAQPGTATPVPPDAAAFKPHDVAMREALAAIEASRNRLEDLDIARILKFPGEPIKARDNLAKAKSRAWERLEAALELIALQRRESLH